MDDFSCRVAPKRPEPQGGFGLIEVLVVIAVIATLALIVIPNVAAVPNSGYSVRCATDLESMQSASAAYASDHGRYATASGGAGTLIESFIVPYYLHTWPNEMSAWTVDANGTIQQTCP